MFPCELHFEKLRIVHHLTFENNTFAKLVMPYSVSGFVLLYPWFGWLWWLLRCLLLLPGQWVHITTTRA